MFSNEKDLVCVHISVINGRGGTDMDQISNVTLFYADGIERDVTHLTNMGMHFYKNDLIEYLGIDKDLVEEYNVDPV